MKVKEETASQLRPANEYDFSTEDTNIAPKFTLPLIDYARGVGESVTFTVTVTCRPEPALTWYHGDEKVTEEDRNILIHEKGVYRLTILEVEAKDAGEWRCHATNDYGEAWCAADLKVIENIPSGVKAPKFARELEYMCVSEGSQVRLECQVSGEPAPKLKWYKDRARIDSDGHFKIKTLEDGTTYLMINGVKADDTGAYMVKAENEGGSTTTEARIRVQKVYDARQSSLEPRMSQAREREHFSMAPVFADHKKTDVAPDFTAKLKNKTAYEGQSVRLACSVTGIPEPSVKWLRDGREIYDNSYYTMRNNYGLLSLEIVLAKESLAGKYSVEATNAAGTNSCHCHVTVEAEEEIRGTEYDILRPKFLLQIETVSVNEGEDAVFKCRGTGKPMPTFKWQRDTLPLTGSRRLEMEYDNTGHASLTIKAAKPSDEGLYYCMAQSRAGRVKCSARLNVKAKALSPSRFDRAYTRSMSVMSESSQVMGAPAMFALMLPEVLDVVDGERLKLDCSVMGIPTPLVTWHKVDRELCYSQRHRIICVGTLHTMEIPQCMTRDKGEYTVRATNCHGTVECVTTVNILPKGTHVRTPPDYRREAMREAAKLSTSSTPFFIKHLPKTIDVMAGIDVRLDCILRKGIELVRWSTSPEGDSKEAKARKQLAEEGFEGDFIPTSSSGAAKDDALPADVKFTSSPTDLVRPVGGEAVFECTTAGASDPDVKWYKDGRQLLKSDSVQMTSSGNHHKLKVTNILRSDQGEFMAKVKSDKGTKSCGATLTVADEPPSAPQPTNPQHVDEEGSKQETAKPRTKQDKEEKASFSVPLPSVTETITGRDVNLTCKVRGQVSKVMWELNSKPLPREARYFVSYDANANEHSLMISKATENDGAKYTCVATLAGGDLISTSTKLQVILSGQSTPSTPAEEAEFKPRFTQGLEDFIVKDGEPLHLSCEVEGNPRPQMAWYRDGVEIFDSQDVQISMIGALCELTITDTFPEDEGDYSCTATNSLGEVNTECYVVVDAPVNN